MGSARTTDGNLGTSLPLHLAAKAAPSPGKMTLRVSVMSRTQQLEPMPIRREVERLDHRETLETQSSRYTDTVKS
jgi:hypothetical protein